LPMFPEALMLHYLDDLDSKMESMRAHFEREAGTEGAWAGYNPSLARPLLNTAKFLDSESATATETEVGSETSPPADSPELPFAEEQTESGQATAEPREKRSAAK